MSPGGSGGGRIEVCTCTEQRDKQQWVGLCVSDTGPGIPPDELPRVFERFFPWVWAAVPLILGTGLWLIQARFGGMGDSPTFVHIMYGLGVVMMLIFMHVFFAPYGRLKKAVQAEDWPSGGKALGQIRMLVGINTLIGLITIAVASGGRYLLT